MALLCYGQAGACASGISLGWEVSEGFLGSVPGTGHGYKCAGQDQWLEAAWGGQCSWAETSHDTA